MQKLLPLLLGLMLLPKPDASGAYLYFWDKNGTTSGAGGATPSGTWGVDPYWSADDKAGNLGTVATEAWTPGKGAVFAAGNDATGTYTVSVSGVVQAGDIHVDLGQITFAPVVGTGASLKIMDPDGVALDRLLSVGHKAANAVARYNVPITTVTNLVRYKRGTVIFGATNTFTGNFTIEGGLVQCAVPNAMGATNPLVLANNSLSRADYNSIWQFTPATFHTGGFDQQLGTLTLLGTDNTVLRVLDLGNGSGTLSFADSSEADWGSFTLTITNYALGKSKLRFGTTSASLTPTQLSQIQFSSFGNLPGQLDINGYLTPALPQITKVTHSSASVQVDWTTISGRTYRLWSKDTLTATSWDYQADAPGTGDIVSFTDLFPSATGRYYRVEVLPLP
jgi:autotransporter-associated beta strand protein